MSKERAEMALTFFCRVPQPLTPFVEKQRRRRGKEKEKRKKKRVFPLTSSTTYLFLVYFFLFPPLRGFLGWLLHHVIVRDRTLM
jgi:hypothetical protein